MKRKLLVFGIALVVAGIVGRSGVVHASCDEPLVISHGGGDANVLIILDNSGSMNEAIVSDAYNPATHYSGNFSSGTTYSISTDGFYSPRHFKSTWPTTPTAYLVNSDQGMSGDYMGNYLNWVYFHTTSSQRAAIPTVTRIQAAKQAVNSVLAGTSGALFGLMVYSSSGNGRLLSPMGTSVSALQSQVNGIKAETYTPLASTLVSALNYYSTTGGSAPIEASCQKSFVVIVTDGLPTNDTQVPSYLKDYNGDGKDCSSCNDYLDDVAMYMYRNDLRADLPGIQNVSTFVIGFNVDANLLQKTADEGGGVYYTVTNGAACASALSRAFDVIAKRAAAGASVSVVSAENRTNNRLFRARYESQTWRGYVESFNLPFHSGDSPLWEAGGLLASRDPNTRNILTSSTGTDTKALTTSNAASLVTLLGAADVTDASNIITYARGGAVTGTRDRGGWVLGDIVDAAPVMVGKPTGFSSLPGYTAFRVGNAGRTEVLYTAANDGMLHCFSMNDGTEQWAYVPKNQLSKLRDLMDPGYCHEYFVNMTPAVYDIYQSGAWKTVLVGGEERGGTGLFALDVTHPSPDTVSVLWDVNLPALGGSWNAPTLVRDKKRNDYLLSVGTGFVTGSSQANLLNLDPTNGSVVSTIALGSPVAGNKTTRATALDIDFDEFTDLLYLGDLTGRLWRVDLRTDPWTASVLFNCGKPIQAAPVVTVDNEGRPLVLFGTGRYLTEDDPASTGTQSLYGIIDDGSGSTVALSSLVDQTSSFNTMASGKLGWFIDLPTSGERITRTGALVAGTLYVPSFIPNATACTGGGQSMLYSVDYKDGSAPSHKNGTENNTTAGRSESMGDGMLADPSVDLVNGEVLLQSSNAVLLTHDVSAEIKKLIVRSWHQKLN